MISDFFINLGATISTWFMSFVPGGNAVDQGIVHAGDGLTNIFALMGSLGVWVDWAALTAAMSAVLALYFGSLLVRVFRTLIGHIPLVGGNG